MNKTNHKSPARPARASAHRMTLLEVLLATFILAMGLVGVMSLVPVSIRQAGRATRSTEAASVAQNAKVSIKALRLSLDNEDTDFSEHEQLEAGEAFNIPYYENADPGNGDFWENADFENYLYGSGEYRFVLADPDEERSYAWQAQLEPKGPENIYYHVELTVFFPPPYAGREVYRTTFMMRRP